MKTTIQCESLSFQRVLRFKKKKQNSIDANISVIFACVKLLEKTKQSSKCVLALKMKTKNENIVSAK